jgi:hypothetical protein
MCIKQFHKKLMELLHRAKPKQCTGRPNPPGALDML